MQRRSRFLTSTLVTNGESMRITFTFKVGFVGRLEGIGREEGGAP
jgi:hypothetical protein